MTATRILFIHHQMALRDRVGAMLEAEGFAVRVVLTDAEALGCLDGADLVLTYVADVDGALRLAAAVESTHPGLPMAFMIAPPIVTIPQFEKIEHFLLLPFGPRHLPNYLKEFLARLAASKKLRVPYPTLMLIADLGDWRAMVQDLLEISRYHVLSVADVAQAELLIQRMMRWPDLLLIKLKAHLRVDEFTASVVQRSPETALLFAAALDELVQVSGDHPIIRLPFRPDDLIREIDEALRGRRWMYYERPPED